MPAIETPGLMLASHWAAPAASLTRPFRRPKAFTRMRCRAVRDRRHRLQVLLDLGESILWNERLRLIRVIGRTLLPLWETALRRHKVLPVAVLGLTIEIPLEGLSLMEAAAIHAVWLLHSWKACILRLGRHDDPVIVLGVLEIVLGRDRVAGGHRVPCKGGVFLSDVHRGPANFHVGSARLIVPAD